VSVRQSGQAGGGRGECCQGEQQPAGVGGDQIAGVLDQRIEDPRGGGVCGEVNAGVVGGVRPVTLAVGQYWGDSDQMIGKGALCFIWVDAVVWVAGQEVAERLVVDAQWSFGESSFEVLAESPERCVDA
jgi:hypothetical protein